MSFLLTKTPILANTDTTNDIFNNLPIGVVVLEKEIMFPSSEFKIHFANKLARRLLLIPKDSNYKKFISKLDNIKEFNMISQREGNLSLTEHVLSQSHFESGKTFITQTQNLLYVKVKHYNSKILISIDNYTEERHSLQNKYVQSIGYQYLLTLYHEINNPLNSLIANVGEILNQDELRGECNLQCRKKKKRIELLVFLIQFFLKNFILYFQVKTITKSDIKDSNAVISISNLIKSMKAKFTKLFQYKEIKQCENIHLLKYKNVKLNYFYFKNLIKMLFIYFYHKNEKGGMFTISAEKGFNEKYVKLIFSNGKPHDILAKSYSSLSESEKLKESNKQKNKIQTTEMTEELITMISSLIDIKVEVHKDSMPVSIVLMIPLWVDDDFGTECDCGELSPSHKTKLSCLNRDIGKTSLCEIKQKILTAHDMSSSDIDDYSSSLIRKMRKHDTKYLSTKPSNLICSLFKTIAKTTKDDAIINDDDILSYMSYRRGSYTNLKIPLALNDTFNLRFNDRMNEHKSFSKRRSPITIVSSEGDEFEEYKCNFFDNNDKIDLIKLDNDISPKHISFFDNGNKESEKTIESPFKCISINQFDNDNEELNNFKLLHPPKKKKRTDICYNKNIIMLNDFEKQLSCPSKKDSVKTVLSPNSSNLSLSSCQCRDVLIVDDEQFNLSCISNILLKLKIKSDLCYDGRECVKRIKDKIVKNCNCNKSYYKLILMDVLMPHMSGKEAAEKIQSLVNDRVLNENVNIVFISACVDQASNFDELKKRIPIAKEFLLKPVKKSKIEEILKKYYYEG